MKEFKFACPSCHQHIQIGAEFESRRVDCPACQTTLIVPAPPKGAGKLPVATLAQPAARPKPVTPPTTKRMPTIPKSPPAGTPPKTKPPASTTTTAKPGPTGSPPPMTPVAPISDLRVATLTPKLKLEIVRAIQLQLADKSRWLPGKKEAGEYNYAARREGDRLVTVSPVDASATHLSLFGAVLREFHRRNIIRVTTGRRKFLDEELPAAIQQVLGKQPGQAPLSEAEREALTHKQCLAVLDVLEQRYEREAEQARIREQERKIEPVRLSDLIKKLEKKAPVRAEEVAAALFYELEELNQRLDELEQNTNSAG